MSDTKGHVKILFEIEGEDGVTENESLWAVPVSDGYRLDNIPFYAKEVALNDVIAASVDPDGALVFSRLVEASGHSTVRLWFEHEESVSAVREELRKLGCASEVDLARLVAVDIPPDVPYDRIRAFLENEELKGILEYEEACLAQV